MGRISLPDPGAFVFDQLPARVPPHNLDAERAVLGTILAVGRAALDRVSARLLEEDFYTERHRVLYRHMLALAERDTEVSVITLADALYAAPDELALVGGPAALAAIATEWTAEAFLPSHVEIVVRHAATRRQEQVLLAALEAAHHSAAPTAVARDVAEQLEQAAARIADGAARSSAPGEAIPLEAAVETLLANLREPETDFVRSPWDAINDRLVGGLLRSEVLTLGGRPGVAKTALAIQWAQHAARQGHRTLIISVEMYAGAVVRRLLAQEVRIPASALRRRDLSIGDWHRLYAQLPEIRALPLAINDTATTLGAIRRLVRGRGYRLVIVDYLQLVRVPAIRDRRLEVSAVSAALKDLAKREQCSVIGLSSLARLTRDKGKQERPDMDKLKESGDVEHDSDVVLILHWPDTRQSERELIFAKVREGETGGPPLTLDFDPIFTRFVVPDAVREPGDEEEVPF